LRINGETHALELDPRVSLLDLLREHLQLTGTKKGCDHGQCGACTVLVNGQRINSCLSFAVMHDGDEITTIEGLAQGGQLHPMQAAFIEQDGLQCGYCTPGQICSAVALLSEVKAGAPSFVTANIAEIKPIDLSDDEIRERMSGNICRCGAYAGIVAAVRSMAEGQKA
jgi:xanthine dehydrogenase YagT iron-sulfur-binding subunit